MAEVSQVTKLHIRHILLYEFNQGANASTATRNIQYTYGKDVLKERTARRWFARFKAGNFSLEDDPRSGRPETIESAKLKSMIENNSSISVRELCKIFNASKTTVQRSLKSIQKSNVVPQRKLKTSKQDNSTHVQSDTVLNIGNICSSQPSYYTNVESYPM